MKTFLSLLSLCVLLVGCSTVTPLQVQNSVSDAVRVGLDIYPQAEPEVRIAGNVVCAEVGKTNVSLASIVKDLEAAGINTKEAKAVVDGAVLAFNALMNLLNIHDHLEKQQPYLDAFCLGIRDALPQAAIASKTSVTVAKRPMVPHLK